MIYLYIVIGCVAFIVISLLIISAIKEYKIQNKYGRCKENNGIVGFPSFSEYKVSRFLDQKFSNETHLIINNLILPGLGKYKDHTTEIDTIIITLRGVYVIETKKAHCKVYGSDDEMNWSYNYENGEVHYHYNPVMQNRNHINRIIEILKSRGIRTKHIPFYNYVIYERGDISGVESDYCFNLDSYLYDDILSKEEAISFDTYNQISCILTEYKNNPPCSKDEHVRNVERFNRDED